MLNSELPGLLRLHKSLAKPAVEMFIRAFQNYPFLRYYFPDKARRNRISPPFFSIPVYLGIRYGEAYATSANLEGAAVWMSSDQYRVSFRSLVRAVPLSVLLKLARSGGLQIKASGEYIDAVHKRAAPAKHWYLWLLGVDPSFQGQGYSSRLLKPMLDRLDRQHIPCYLDTLDEVNVAIYEHFGFTVVEKSTIPGTSLTVWAMLRQ